MKLENIVKILLGGIATILLGAIGSGVWEKLLSPGLRRMSDFTTSKISSLSQTYSDSIYSRASFIATYDQSRHVAAILLLIISVWGPRLQISKVNKQQTFQQGPWTPTA